MSIHLTVAVEEQAWHFGIGRDDPGDPDAPSFSQIPVMTYNLDPRPVQREEHRRIGAQPIRVRRGEGFERLTIGGRYGAPTASANNPMMVALEEAYRSEQIVTLSNFTKQLRTERWIIDRYTNRCTKMENGIGVEFTYSITFEEA